MTSKLDDDSHQSPPSNPAVPSSSAETNNTITSSINSLNSLGSKKLLSDDQTQSAYSPYSISAKKHQPIISSTKTEPLIDLIKSIELNEERKKLLYGQSYSTDLEETNPSSQAATTTTSEAINGVASKKTTSRNNSLNELNETINQITSSATLNLIQPAAQQPPTPISIKPGLTISTPTSSSSSNNGIVNMIPSSSSNNNLTTNTDFVDEFINEYMLNQSDSSDIAKSTNSKPGSSNNVPTATNAEIITAPIASPNAPLNSSVNVSYGSNLSNANSGSSHNLSYYDSNSGINHNKTTLSQDSGVNNSSVYGTPNDTNYTESKGTAFTTPELISNSFTTPTLPTTTTSVSSSVTNPITTSNNGTSLTSTTGKSENGADFNILDPDDTSW